MVAAFSYIIKKCIPPHPSCYTLGTFSRLGEGFYRYALCKKLGCSCQLPHSTTPDSCIQLCPRGTPMQSAQGVRSTTEGESRKRPEESLLSSGRFRLSPATGALITAAFQFKSTFLSRRTQVLCFFLDSRKKRNPSSPLAPSFFPPISKKICVSGWKRRPFAL